MQASLALALSYGNTQPPDGWFWSILAPLSLLMGAPADSLLPVSACNGATQIVAERAAGASFVSSIGDLGCTLLTGVATRSPPLPPLTVEGALLPPLPPPPPPPNADTNPVRAARPAQPPGKGTWALPPALHFRHILPCTVPHRTHVPLTHHPSHPPLRGLRPRPHQVCETADPPPSRSLQLSATLRFIPSLAAAAGVLPSTGPQPFFPALLDGAAAAVAPMWRRFGYCVRQPWQLAGGRNATVYLQVQLVLWGCTGILV